MIRKRSASERGHGDHGWLDTHHTFSFGDYHDPRQMGFRSLRVINEDRVAAGEGFPRHPHRDMEILTWVLEGALEHKDSLGSGSVIRPGDLQRMSAGTGIFHSEFNPSRTEAVHFLQIWIIPERQGLKPGYEQKDFGERLASGKTVLLASPDGRDGSATVRQDVHLHAARLAPGGRVDLPLASGRHAWVQVTGGALTLNGVDLEAGDGAAVSEEDRLELVAGPGGGAELLVFDLA